jgi:hypothetical protein
MTLGLRKNVIWIIEPKMQFFLFVCLFGIYIFINKQTNKQQQQQKLSI